MSQPGPAQGSRQLIVVELLPWTLALARPSALRGAHLPYPGTAGNRPHCAWACMWPRGQPAWEGAVESGFPSSPAPPTPPFSGAPVQGGPASLSLPAAPCQLGPTQQAWLSGCYSVGSPAAWDSWDGAKQSFTAHPGPVFRAKSH